MPAHRLGWVLVILPAFLVEPGYRLGDVAPIGDVLIDVAGIVLSAADDRCRVGAALQRRLETSLCRFSRIRVRRPRWVGSPKISQGRGTRAPP
jgi:hypothetical protein